jgi:DNA-binding protein
MSKKAIHIDDLHFEHKLWKRQLEFEKDELKIFNSRLEEVVVRWTDKDILKQVEHFQNIFIRHNEVIDILLHDINIHQDELIKEAKNNPVAIDHVHFDDHGDMREKVETQNKMYAELKEEFMRLLSIAM